MLFVPIRYISNGEPLDQITLNRYGFDMQENLEQIIARVVGVEGSVAGSVPEVPHTLALRDVNGTTQFAAPIVSTNPIRLGDTNTNTGWDSVIGKLPRVLPNGSINLGNVVNFYKAGAPTPTMSATMGADNILNFSGRLNTQDVYIRSDIRDKEDLVVIADALNKLKKLTGYDYLQTQFNQRAVSIIAQDLQKILPNAVHEESSDDGDGRLNIQLAGVVALLVEAVKELSQRVDQNGTGTES